MSAPPKTIIHAAPAEAAAIRAAVREARGIDTLGGVRVVADRSHAASLAAMLADPAVSAPIYDLPHPVNEHTIARWIEAHAARRAAGEGLLILNLDSAGAVSGYTDATIWPERASGEIGGALRRDMQGGGQGGAGALIAFNWLFETIGVRLMCLTAALDNERSARLIDAAGFTRMGRRDCVRADGTPRPSLYWEMTREQWRALHARVKA